MRADADDTTPLPFPIAPVSNGEWCPLPITRQQRQAARLIAEESAVRARRLGMTRAEFLRTAAGTATAFWVLNTVYGLDSWGPAAAMPVKREHCDNLAAGRALLDRRFFVMDVQTHHVDTTLPYADTFCYLRFGERYRDLARSCPDRTRLLSQLNFVKEVFVDSETDVGVVSGVPTGILLPPQTMADTRDLVNRLAGSPRALSQAMIDPKEPPSHATSIASMEHQVKDLGAAQLKCYTYSGNWWLDDEQVSYPMLAEATRLGIKLINCHKGLPNTLLPGSAE
jgi:hypothetical protein